MENLTNNRNELKEKLDSIIEQGFQADKKHLKSDMCAQFSNYREWIREYVVNSYDANASYCEVTGTESEDLITIIVTDDGRGMNKDQIKNYFTLYRSDKSGNEQKAVGQHGIGKLSVAAIPGFKKLALITSTGEECWQTETDALLEDKPIQVNRLKKVRPKGTQFEISFEKKTDLNSELIQLSKILEKYVQYLPMEIVVRIPKNNENMFTEQRITIIGSWYGSKGEFLKSYVFDYKGKNYELHMSIGTPYHEIYQKRVFITDKYAFFNQDIKKSNNIPYIRIKLESPHFVLPFGRHCISDESELFSVAELIRNKYLPDYFRYLTSFDDMDFYNGSYFNHNKLHELTVKLIAENVGYNRPWYDQPVFRVYPNKYFSFNELASLTQKGVELFLEDPNTPGIDYSVFNTPVIRYDQPGDGLKLVKQLLGNKLINLSLNDIILETPSITNLSEAEKKFENSLFFYPEALSMIDNIEDVVNRDMEFDFDHMKDKFEGVIAELNNASNDLKLIKWRLNYLVAKDGKTPCVTHKFIYKNDTVVLNLNHEEIKAMVELSKHAPALASHWMLAICLTENKDVLSNYSIESKEDLLLIDAIIKLELGINKEEQKARNKQIMKMLFQYFSNHDRYNISLN